jgi:hypothetical protein
VAAFGGGKKYTKFTAGVFYFIYGKPTQEVWLRRTLFQAAPLVAASEGGESLAMEG